VYASYHRFENLEVIVHDLNYRSRAIRSAGRSGHNPVFLGIVTRMINSENEHRCIDGWCGDDDSFCAAVDVHLHGVTVLFW